MRNGKTKKEILKNTYFHTNYQFKRIVNSLKTRRPSTTHRDFYECRRKIEKMKKKIITRKKSNQLGAKAEVQESGR